MFSWSLPTGLRGFRGRLTLWFGGLTLLTLLSVGLYVGRMATQQLVTASGEALHSTAQSAADLLGANLREREQEILLMSQSPQFTSGQLDHPEVLRLLERRKVLHDDYAWLGVADAAGVVRQATGGMLVQQSVLQRPWFQAASRGVYTGDIHEAVLLSKLLPGNSSGEPLRFIDFAAPIRSTDGRLLGVLGAHAHWNWVTQTVESAVRHQGRRPEVEVLILNRAGDVLYPERLVGTLRLPQRIGGESHDDMVRWPDGLDYLSREVAVTAGTVNDLGWRIVVRLPTQIALQPVNALRQQLLVLGLLAALLFAFVAYQLASRMSYPIERLARAVRQVERREGEPDFAHAHDTREVAQLSQSIQSMTHSLLVKERELEAVNASLELLSGTARNVFRACTFEMNTSLATDLHVTVGASGMDRYALFDGCVFINAVDSTSTTINAAIVANAAAGGSVVLNNPISLGATALATTGPVYVTGAVPTATTSGIAIKAT